MQVTNSSQISQSSQEVFKVIQQAQQQNGQLAEKMIRLSLEQKMSRQKDVLTDALVDLYL